MPTERDIWCFQIFRTMVGVIVFGLVASMFLGGLMPLAVEGLRPAPPAPPPTPSQPFKLWTEHDSQAGRTILVISAVQFTLLATCYFAYQWRKRQQQSLKPRPRGPEQPLRSRRRPRQRRRDGDEGHGVSRRSEDRGNPPAPEATAETAVTQSLACEPCPGPD